MNFPNFSHKKALITIFAVALILRLGFGIYYFNKHGVSDFDDDWKYISYANNIISQGIFVPDISRLPPYSHFIGPGYPLVVAGLFSLFGENYMAVIIMNAIASTGICILIYLLGREIFDRKIALYAAAWSVIYVLFIWRIPRVLKDTWTIFLFTLFIYILVMETKRVGFSIKSIIPIILYSLLIHTDERFLAFLPLILGAFILLDREDRKKGMIKIKVTKASLFFIGVIILMIPWTIRNYMVYEKPVILTERAALFTDKIFGVDPEKRVSKSMKDLGKFKRPLIDSLLAGLEVKSMKGKGVESLKRALRKGITPHQFSIPEKWKTALVEFFRPVRLSGGFISEGYRYRKAWSLRHNLSTGITYGLLLPLLPVGIYLILRNRNSMGIFLIAVILYHTLLHVMVLFSVNRYRLPIDPLIILVSFYGLSGIVRSISNR